MTDDDTMTEALRAAGQKLVHDKAIEEYKAGHAERMAAAQARVDENLRRHAIDMEREAKRNTIVARILAAGGAVHDGNCCEDERIDLPRRLRHAGGSVNINLEQLGHEGDPGLLVLEVIALILESYNA